MDVVYIHVALCTGVLALAISIYWLLHLTLQGIDLEVVSRYVQIVPNPSLFLSVLRLRSVDCMYAHGLRIEYGTHESHCLDQNFARLDQIPSATAN